MINSIASKPTSKPKINLRTLRIASAVHTSGVEAPTNDEPNTRLNDINQAIASIEKQVGIQGFSMSATSKAAIVRTYLNNPNLRVTPETVVVRPLLDNAPNMERGNEWVRAHPPEVQELARFLLDHLTYIDQNQFEKALEEIMPKLSVALGDRPYASVSYYPDKSENWIKSLANEKGMRSAAAHLEAGEPSFERDVEIALAQGIKDFVIFDDAAYSGHSVAWTIDVLREEGRVPDDVLIHVVIPYVTKTAVKVIQQPHEGNPLTGMKRIKSIPPRPNIFFYSSRRLLTITEILKTISDDDFRSRMIKALKDMYGKSLLTKTLTYFQHKVPDGFSFVTSIKTGLVTRQWNVENPRIIAVIKFLDKLIPSPYTLPQGSSRFDQIRDILLARSSLPEDGLRLALYKGISERLLAVMYHHGLRLQWMGTAEARDSELFKPDNSPFALNWEHVAKFPAAPVKFFF